MQLPRLLLGLHLCLAQPRRATTGSSSRGALVPFFWCSTAKGLAGKTRGTGTGQRALRRSYCTS